MNWYKRAKSEEEPWTMTQQEFIDYHYTGGISSDAYQSYKTVKGMSWIKKEKYPALHSTKQFGPKKIEFRQSGEKQKFYKYDNSKSDYFRDENNNLIPLTDEEIRDKGKNLYDETIIAFDGDTAVGMVSNEWGADGLWVVEDYQRLGIGTYLLTEFRKQFKPGRKMGQMTPAGAEFARKYHKDQVRKALLEGKTVPDEVLKDYPDLRNRENWSVEPYKKPFEPTVNKNVTLYRGKNNYSQREGYWSTDREYARQFTQSGLNSEILTVKIPKDKIYRQEPLPSSMDETQEDQAIANAKEKGFQALWVKEGSGEPDSVLVLDRAVLYWNV